MFIYRNINASNKTLTCADISCNNINMNNNILSNYKLSY